MSSSARVALSLLLVGAASAFSIGSLLSLNECNPLFSSTSKVLDGAGSAGDLLGVDTSVENDAAVDTRPHEQRADGPRLARRLNHGFRYLYRHNSSEVHNMTSWEYLNQFYNDDVLVAMNATFPPLLTLGVRTQLHPKIQFLKRTLHVSNITTVDVPSQYFGARLERTMAPRHAFLMHHGLPHGRELLDTPSDQRPDLTRWHDFLMACRKTKRFCALCNQWRSEHDTPITAKQVEAFDFIFGRGLLAAARDELCQPGNEWPLQHVNLNSAQLIPLLVKHGADPLALDNRGVSLVHWAAGTGNLNATRVLLPYMPGHVGQRTKRDGATPLHWAAAGSNSREFGTGGHVDVCRYLLEACGDADSSCSAKELVNRLTYDGNSALMWAGWSGSLHTVKLLVRNRADTAVKNRNGCTVAHWAASGGSLECCKYLADVVGVSFFEPNYGGNTPLTHAVAFGRIDIVKWLREQDPDENDDMIAASLAQDFCDWEETAGDATRQKVLQLFRDDYWEIDKEDDDFDDESVELRM